MLFSAELPLPKTIYSHGFINGPDGQKMSKSIGNVVDPHDVINTFGSDIFRYFCLKEGTFGSDIDFKNETLEYLIDSDLANVIGNLARRALTLTHNNY